VECRYRLDYTALSRVLRTVAEQHQAFKFKLQWRAGSWRAFLGPEPNIIVETLSIGKLAAPEQDKYLTEVEPHVVSSIDSVNGPVARFIYIDRGSKRSPLLWIALDHLVSDHYSILVLLRNIEESYRQTERSGSISLKNSSSSLKAWVGRLNDMAHSPEIESDRSYWLESCATAPKRMQSTKFSQGNELASAGSHVVMLDPAITEKLRQRTRNPASRDREVLALIMSALGVAYRKWIDADRMVLSLVNSGRSSSLHGLDLSQTVACTFHAFPFAAPIGADSPSLIDDTVKKMHAAMNSVPHRGIAYYLLRYLRPDSDVARELASVPVPEITLNYRGTVQSDPSSMFSGLNWQLSGARVESSKELRQPLLIDSAILEGSLITTFTYSNLLQCEIIERLAQAYIEYLKQIIA
jgi:non-ribosomal peptide synthase protein (TIGR01720 family)